MKILIDCAVSKEGYNGELNSKYLHLEKIGGYWSLFKSDAKSWPE